MRTRRHRALRITAIGIAATALLTALPAGLAVAGIKLDRATQLRLPRDAARNSSGFVLALDCVRAGFCTAGGGYVAKPDVATPMVVTQARGRWARATALTMPADASASSYAVVNSVRCAAVGSCEAAGYYYVNGSIQPQGFVASQIGGRWGPARDITAPKGGGDPAIYALSCLAPGSCVAAGAYSNRKGNYQPMEVTEVKGRWRRAQPLRLPRGVGQGFILSLSCPRYGYCSGVGGYLGASDFSYALAVTESGGTWHRAVRVTLPKGALPDASSLLSSVTCLGAGSCSAVGFYANASDTFVPMAATQSRGRWAAGHAVNARPGNASRLDNAFLSSISCINAASCVGLGSYTTRADKENLMMVTESSGKWRIAQEIALPPDGGAGSPPESYIPMLQPIGSVDCLSTGYCAAGSYYVEDSAKYDALAVVAHAR